MQDTAPPAISRMAATLPSPDDTPAPRPDTIPSARAGRRTIAVAVLCAGGLTGMLSDVPATVALALTAAVMLALITLMVADRRTHSASPTGWDSRLAASTLVLYVAALTLTGSRAFFEYHPHLPVWAAVAVALVLAAPLATSGLWLARRRLPPAALQPADADDVRNTP